jgi:hypothetical protein
MALNKTNSHILKRGMRKNCNWEYMTVSYREQSKGIEYLKILIIHCVISFSFRSAALLGKVRTDTTYHKYKKGGGGEQKGGISSTTELANNESPLFICINTGKWFSINTNLINLVNWEVITTNNKPDYSVVTLTVWCMCADSKKSVVQYRKQICQNMYAKNCSIF